MAVAAASLACCLALPTVMQKVAFDIGPSDPGVLALAIVVMLVTAIAACWFPARRRCASIR